MAAESKSKKQRGYRVRVTIFIPADPKDMTATRSAIDFADTYAKLSADAPKGTVIEKFQAMPGQAGEDE